MALVDDLLLGRADDTYAVAARQRSAAAPGALLHDRRVRTGTALAGLLVAGLVVGTAGAAHHASRPDASADRAGLVEAVEQRRSTIRTAEAQVSRSRAALTSPVDDPSPAPVPLDPEAAALAGTAELAGPGVVLTVTDPPVDDPALAFRLQDRDLQVLVNALWAAGATGVSVNGRRLTALTAIREAGGVVLVGYRAVTSPYVVSATGDPTALEDGFTRGSGGTVLRNLADGYGVDWDLTRSSDLRLPAAVVSLRSAELDAAAAGAGTDGPAQPADPTGGASS